MDFVLNELQLEIRELAGSLLRDTCTPAQLSALEAGAQRLDLSLWAQLGAAGLTAIPVPAAAGGAGLAYFEACLVFEQLGATTAAVPLVGHTLAAMALIKALGEEVAADWLAGPGWLACSTRLEGNTLRLTDGRLSGELSAVAYAAGSRGMLLPAHDGTAWRLCLLTEQATGVVLEAQTSTGLEPQSLFTATAAPVQVLPGDTLLSWLQQRMTVALCMAQLGVVGAALELARQHVCEREQFGVKIGSFQAVAHRMADGWIDLMNLRLAAQTAASALDHHTLASLDVGTAQVWAADAGHRVLASCQHVHGGLGHDRDYPLWRLAVWARQYEMVLGGAGLALEQLGAAIAADPEAAFL